MKRIFTITIACILAGATSGLKAQILTPVHWTYAAKKISATEAVIFIKASIEDGWHLYSENVEEGGPVKTSFTFQPGKDYIVEGKTIEPKPVTRFEKVFSMNVSFFEHEAIFQQRIKLKTGQTTVKGTLEYMTCNRKECLPPEDISFSVVVK